jgi:drug/metabolite transporter (DMT)-like permease
VASLITALAPLFLMILSALFLGERITLRRVLGFLIAVTGLAVIAGARDTEGAFTYPALIALTTLAPLCWSCHSVITKTVAGRVSPLVWTYLAVVMGTVPLLPLLPFAGLPEMAALDAAGWGYLAYLSVFCTVVGFALWTWLLSRLQASTVGFTIFLNPPMTTGYKYLLAALFPAVFAFTVAPGEALGGLVVLAGVAVAVLRIRN